MKLQTAHTQLFTSETKCLGKINLHYNETLKSVIYSSNEQIPLAIRFKSRFERLLPIDINDKASIRSKAISLRFGLKKVTRFDL